MDTQGRVEKFQKAQEQAKKFKAQTVAKKEKKSSDKKAKSLAELLGEM